MEFLQHFNYTVVYIEGELNKVADCLLCYYATDNWEEKHPSSKYMNADSRLDPMGEDLLLDRAAKLRAIAVDPRTGQLPEATEERTILADQLIQLHMINLGETLMEIEGDPT